MSRNNSHTSPSLGRLNFMAVTLLLIGVVFLGRLFQLQVINGQQYREQADSGQITSLTIPASRGQVYAQRDGQRVPLVLNAREWLLFSDTAFIESRSQLIDTLEQNNIFITSFQKDQLDTDNRYVVLAQDIQDELKQSIEDSGVKGLYFQPQNTRNYSEGSLAAHVLGFVNNDGSGQYGVEEFFDQELTGTNGQLRAVTDANGVPLAFEQNNILVEPVDGQDVTLTIDVDTQQIVESALRSATDRLSAQGASGVVLDAETGKVLAMANYPTFEPQNFEQVGDVSLFDNPAISDAVEPGSALKTLVAAAALDTGAVDADYSYFDDGSVVLDEATVTNAINYSAQDRSFTDILRLSLNTGSINLLAQLGGGQVNEQARTTLYSYLTEAHGLGQATGIQLPNESSGIISGPNDGFGLNIRYGNITFGQGLTLTPLQLAAAYIPIVNDGLRYKPYIIESVGDSISRPELVTGDTSISPQTSASIREVLDDVAQTNYPTVQVDGLEISGKTGTAQIPDGQGGYQADGFTGTFAGYIRSDNTNLVIAVKIDEPQGVRFAGTDAARPLWQDIVSGLLNAGKVR